MAQPCNHVVGDNGKEDAASSVFDFYERSTTSPSHVDVPSKAFVAATLRYADDENYTRAIHDWTMLWKAPAILQKHNRPQERLPSRGADTNVVRRFIHSTLTNCECHAVRAEVPLVETHPEAIRDVVDAWYGDVSAMETATAFQFFDQKAGNAAEQEIVAHILHEEIGRLRSWRDKEVARLQAQRAREKARQMQQDIHRQGNTPYESLTTNGTGNLAPGADLDANGRPETNRRYRVFTHAVKKCLDMSGPGHFRRHRRTRSAPDHHIQSRADTVWSSSASTIRPPNFDSHAQLSSESNTEAATEYHDGLIGHPYSTFKAASGSPISKRRGHRRYKSEPTNNISPLQESLPDWKEKVRSHARNMSKRFKQLDWRQ